MRDVLVARWNEVGDKVAALAREFPEQHYDAVPVEGMRSFGEQLRHLAFWNLYAEQALRGGRPGGDANTLPQAEFATRTAIVEAVERSFRGVAGALAGNGTAPDLDTAVGFLEHSGEHYGQLVVYYRLRGMVPPASRG